MAVTQSSPLSQPAIVTDLRDKDWPSINKELASMIAPLHTELANDIAAPCEAAVEFASLITAHLDHHGVLGRNSASRSQQQHRDRAIVRLTKRLARTIVEESSQQKGTTF